MIYDRWGSSGLVTHSKLRSSPARTGLEFMTLQSKSESNCLAITKWNHLHNYEHVMGNLEPKELIYLCHNCFWTQNRTPRSDEYKAFDISQLSCEIDCIPVII